MMHSDWLSYVNFVFDWLLHEISLLRTPEFSRLFQDLVVTD